MQYKIQYILVRGRLVLEYTQDPTHLCAYTRTKFSDATGTAVSICKILLECKDNAFVVQGLGRCTPVPIEAFHPGRAGSNPYLSTEIIFDTDVLEYNISSVDSIFFPLVTFCFWKLLVVNLLSFYPVQSADHLSSNTSTRVPVSPVTAVRVFGLKKLFLIWFLIWFKESTIIYF